MEARREQSVKMAPVEWSIPSVRNHLLPSASVVVRVSSAGVVAIVRRGWTVSRSGVRAVVVSTHRIPSAALPAELTAGSVAVTSILLTAVRSVMLTIRWTSVVVTVANSAISAGLAAVVSLRLGVTVRVTDVRAAGVGVVVAFSTISLSVWANITVSVESVVVGGALVTPTAVSVSAGLIPISATWIVSTSGVSISGVSIIDVDVSGTVGFPFAVSVAAGSAEIPVGITTVGGGALVVVIIIVLLVPQTEPRSPSAFLVTVLVLLTGVLSALEHFSRLGEVC